MKLLICGHGRHGKDSVADLLCDFNNYKASSSSVYAMKVLEDVIMAHTGYSSFAECYEKRSLHRPYLYELIRNYNTPDKARLSREILQEHQIYVGMRDLEEFNASKHLYDLKIWVDASGRGVPLEPVTSFNIPKDEFDVIIENNGTYDQLVHKVARLANSLQDHPGKIVGSFCDGVNLHYVRSDGKGAHIRDKVAAQYNSVKCGYSGGVTVKQMIEHFGYTK